MRRGALALALAAVTAGCAGGTGGDQAGPAVRQALLARALDAVRPDAPPENPRATITRAGLDITPTPILLVEFERTGQGVILAPGGRNGEVVRWSDAEGGGLSLRRGVLVGTYGLGFDLQGADVDPLLAALRAGGGEAARLDTYLRGDVEVVGVRSLCRVVPRGAERIDNIGRTLAVRVFDEECEGPAGAFTNRYWVEADGRVRRSLQRVSDEVGRLRIELLTD